MMPALQTALQQMSNLLVLFVKSFYLSIDTYLLSEVEVDVEPILVAVSDERSSARSCCHNNIIMILRSIKLLLLLQCEL
jgi:hypothetical protein